MVFAANVGWFLRTVPPHCHCEERSDVAIRKPLQKILRFAQNDTVVWWLSQHNVGWFLRTAPPHCHCEERSDVAIRYPLQ